MLPEHEFSVPLDHTDPGGERITVFAREVAEPDGLDRPFLVYFEGGPGHEAPRPTRRPSSPGWLDRALREFRVLMLDQRGTGRSSPIEHMEGLTAARQAERLACFRADAIVRDAEVIRAQLGVDRWSVLGQSFGGFCVTAYLSIAPGGLREALITGGLPAFDVPIDDVYAYTFSLMASRSRDYYVRYPGDRERVRALAARLDADDVRLPDGDPLTSRRLRQLGQLLGFSDGAERLHALLEQPNDSLAFRHDVQAAVPYARNPLYALLQEACWADGLATHGRQSASARPNTTTPSCSSASTCSRGCSTTTARSRRCAMPPTCWRAAMAAALRPRPARGQRGPSRSGDLRERPLRPAAILRADRRADRWPTDLADRRVRAQRSARRGERILDRLLDLARGR